MGVMVHNHIVSPVSNWFALFSFHVNLTNNFWDTANSKFDLEISKVKVKGDVKGHGQTDDPVFNQCTSFSFDIHISPKYLRLSWNCFDVNSKVVVVVVDTAEINWKHKVTPDQGDLIKSPVPVRYGYILKVWFSNTIWWLVSWILTDDKSLLVQVIHQTASHYLNQSWSMLYLS